MSMFHHSLYTHCNSRKPYLNKSIIVAQNGKFFKNLFNKKYVKFIIKLMSKIVFFVKNKSITKKTTFYVTNGMPTSSSIWHTFLKLEDGPMRRQVAIRWTNRKTAGAVWACATQIVSN